MLCVKRALISVSDKTNLIHFAKVLKKLGVEIISTGGTQKLLSKNKISSKSVTDETGFPEILDGRVKTLHPKIYGGLLYLRENSKHRKTIKEHGIKPIDLVVVNLYPFQKVVGSPKVKLAEAIENIDIGGPTMLRAAAKNYASVAVLTDPADYEQIINELQNQKGRLSEETLKQLALKAFQHTAVYDRAISHFLGRQFSKTKNELPNLLDVSFKKSSPLRYGENPHQRAALYQRTEGQPKFSFRKLHGKEISYNNILDLDAAVDIMREFREPSACVVKHNNPCGIAINSNIGAALAKAIECDPLSSFGGIVAVNRIFDRKSASLLLERLSFFELLIAPEITKDAFDLLKVRKNLRVIEIPNYDHIGPYDLRFVKSGVLLQDRNEPIYYHLKDLKKNLRVATKSKPSTKELESLLFAWSCAKVVRSNAIVLVQGKQTVGIGCGQMSRVDSVKIACEKARPRAEGSVMASDGFFPMADNITLAHLHHIRAIIQPGGSIRDAEVIEACDRYGIAMVFASERHFKH